MGSEKDESVSTKVDKLSDWKSALSGALNDTQLSFALVVLFIFFIVYIIVDGFFIDNNRKDVDVVKDIQNQDCNCKSSHKQFYIIWFTICSALWVLGPFVLWIFQCCCCCSCRESSNSNCNCTCFIEKVQDWIAKKLESVNSMQLKQIGKTILGVLKLFKVDKMTGPLQKIEKLKWLEYYNLHITGDHIKKVKFKKIKKRILKEICPSENSNKQKVDSNQEKFLEEEVDVEKIGGYCFCCSNCCMTCLLTCSVYFVCLFLECTRIITQRATVPLLMIQAFDTYAFLCFTGNSYCTKTTQYDIPLGQASFTFAFSASIMVSTLAVAMLKWFKYQRKMFLCCCKNSINCSQYKLMQSCI